MPHDCLSGSSPVEHLGARPSLLGAQEGWALSEKCSQRWELESQAPWPLCTPSPQDLELFREAGGWDVVRAVAEFWCSRVEWSPEEEKYHLKGEER